jgi:hypothetical protein
VTDSIFKAESEKPTGSCAQRSRLTHLIQSTSNERIKRCCYERAWCLGCGFCPTDPNGPMIQDCVIVTTYLCRHAGGIASHRLNLLKRTFAAVPEVHDGRRRTWIKRLYCAILSMRHLRNKTLVSLILTTPFGSNCSDQLEVLQGLLGFRCKAVI